MKTDVLSHAPIRWKPLLQRSSLSWNQDHRSLKPYLISLSIRNTRCKWKAVSISSRSVENMKRDGNDWQPIHSSSVRHSEGAKAFIPVRSLNLLIERKKVPEEHGGCYIDALRKWTLVPMWGGITEGTEQRKVERERFRAKPIRLRFYSLTKTSLKRRGDGVLKESPSLYRETDRK